MSWTDPYSRRKASEVKIELIELYNKALLTHEEVDKIKKLEEELKEIRYNCRHDYSIVPLFVTVKRICDLCEHEDPLYDHFTYEKKESKKFGW